MIKVICVGKDKGKVHPRAGHKCPDGEVEVELYSLTLVLDGCAWSTHFTSRERHPIPILYEAGWVPGPGWMGAENLATTRIRSLESPACSELQY